MASNTSNNTKPEYAAVAMIELEGTLTCSVCLDIFKSPQVLQCQHSLCRACAQVLMHNNQVLCPECREVTEEARIKTNFSLQSVSEWYKKEHEKQPADTLCTKAVNTSSSGSKKLKKQDSKNVCVLCDMNEALFYCQTCERCLCSVCRQSHVKITACKEDDAEKMQTTSCR